MRILIAGKTAFLRNALTRFLQHRSEYDVVGTAADEEQLFSMVEAESPDLLLLDDTLVDDLVQEVILPIRQREHGPQVLILGGRSESKQTFLDAGATAYVSKSAPPKNLMTTIEEIRLRGSSA